MHELDKFKETKFNVFSTFEPRKDAKLSPVTSLPNFSKYSFYKIAISSFCNLHFN